MHTGHGRSGKGFPKLGLPPASEIVIASVVSWKQMSMFSQTNVPWHIEQQDLTKKKSSPGGGGQGRRSITATCLRMARLLRVACYGYSGCKSLVSIG